MEEEEGGEGGRAGGDVGDGGVGGDGDGIVGRRVGQGGCGSHVVFVLMMGWEWFGCSRSGKRGRWEEALYSCLFVTKPPTSFLLICDAS